MRPIVGVSTSTTAFVGRAMKGPVDEATLIHGFGDYERVFGGLWNESRMSFAVRQYFQNGGRDAIIVRVAPGATPATWALPCPQEKDAKATLALEASSPGAWANELVVTVDDDTLEKVNGKAPAKATLFNLIVLDQASGESETLRNLSMVPDSATFFVTVLKQRSRFLRAPENKDPKATPLVKPPEKAEKVAPGAVDKDDKAAGAVGKDGQEITDADLAPAEGKTGGISALGVADAFNLLCLPPLTESKDVSKDTYKAAILYLKEEQRRAMVIVDPPGSARSAADAKAFKAELDPDDRAALFFPRLLAPNPRKDNLIEEFAPCGAVAGVFAGTDAQRGVWKAPAGTEARVAGIDGLTVTLTNQQNGELNPLGINSIRSLPQIGAVLWGSRTLRGADALADQWKYIPVRRLAFFLEDSLQRGLSWVVFEPNDEPLWAQIRLNVGSFMNGLFRQGAFQGTTPAQAYFVKCDAETTIQDDIDRGIVNVVVGFAPLKPAEFVVLKIQQVAGQGAA